MRHPQPSAHGDVRIAIRSRLFKGASLLVVLLWGGIALALHALHGETFARATATGSNLALSLAAQQASSVRAIDLALHVLRSEWVRDPVSFAAAVERNEAYLKQERVIQVAVVDGEGWLAYSRLPQQGRVNFADRDYFQQHRDGTVDVLDISAPVQGRITRRWAIQFTRALRDAQGRFAGLVVVAVPPPALELSFKDLDLGTDGVISLVHGNGAVLARTSEFERGIAVGLGDGPGLRPGDPPSGEFRRRAKIDGIERVVSYRRLEGYPLTIYVGQSVATVLEPYREQRNVLLAAGALGTLLVLSLALLGEFRRRERASYRERQERLMRDLHDGCIQAVYAVGLQLQSCRRLIASDPAKAERSLAEAGAGLSLVIQDLRAFIAGSTRAVYSEEEFMAELDRLFPGGDAGPAFSLDVDRAAVRSLGPGDAEQVLRIAREAISNVLRHAKAKTARISLEQRDGRFRLQVCDDGVGIDEAGSRALGLGLNHIQVRAKKLGGRATIDSAAGEGTRISVEWPNAA